MTTRFSKWTVLHAVGPFRPAFHVISPTAHPNLTSANDSKPQNFASWKMHMKLYKPINTYLTRTRVHENKTLHTLNKTIDDEPVRARAHVCVLWILIMKIVTYPNYNMWIWNFSYTFLKVFFKPHHVGCDPSSLMHLGLFLCCHSRLFRMTTSTEQTTLCNAGRVPSITTITTDHRDWVLTRK